MRIASSMENPTSVTFLGHVEREKLPGLMSDSTVCCVPSFGEAFGLVALEAMACGRPIVGTDASGLAHLITDKGGIKVRAGDPQALAQALLRVLENPELARSMGEHNRKLAEQRYAWPSVVTRVEEAYHAAGQIKPESILMSGRPLKVLSISHTVHGLGSGRLRYEALAKTGEIELVVVAPDRWRESGVDRPADPNSSVLDLRFQASQTTLRERGEVVRALVPRSGISHPRDFSRRAPSLGGTMGGNRASGHPAPKSLRSARCFGI